MALYKPSLSPITMSAVLIAAPISPTAFIMNSWSFVSFTACGAVADMSVPPARAPTGGRFVNCAESIVASRASQSRKVVPLLLRFCYSRARADTFLHFGRRAGRHWTVFTLGRLCLVPDGEAAPG